MQIDSTSLLRALLAGLCILASPLSHGAADRARPNIVVLVADDLGFSDFGSFGSEIKTPHIDGLARQGARFSNFHVTASCSPTRSILLTGVDNHRNGVGNMPETMPAEHKGKPGYSGVLDDNAITLATMLKDNGYRTYVVGKWHLGKTPDTLPPNRGFERSFIQADSGSDNWQPKPYVFLYDKANWYEQGKEIAMPSEFYTSRLIVDKTIEYISADAKDGKPFFAYVAFQANHIPVQAPQEEIDKYQGFYKDGWTALRDARRARAAELGLVPKDAAMVTMSTTADWNALTDEQKRYEARRMEVYAGMATAMDSEIGRLIAHLKKTGQYDNTVFVVLSDNGAEPTDPYDILVYKMWLYFHYTNDISRLGGKGAMSSIGPSWASAAASPLNGYKFFAGEGGLRVPLIVSGIPGMKPDQVSGAFSFVSDIVPTLLDAAGVKPHDGQYNGKKVEPMIGSSLMPVMLGKAELVHPADQPVGYELSGSAAMFKGEFKLVKSLTPVGDEQWHLYNLAKDPGEVNDLRGQLPEVYKAMQADYAEYVRANGVLPMPAGYNYKVQGQLYALDYVVIPKLKAMLPALVLGLVVLVGGFVVWRRRRASARKA